jgi:Probable zinc-ribbon domain
MSCRELSVGINRLRSQFDRAFNMKSNKLRRAEIKVKRLNREAVKPVLKGGEDQKEIPTGSAPCNPENLAPFYSYDAPDFVDRGYYLDVLFCCASCQQQEVWRAIRQKWWYEVAKGKVESRAKLCKACRHVARERKAEARRVHLEGLQAKYARRQQIQCNN